MGEDFHLHKKFDTPEYPWINPKITFETAVQKQLNSFVKDNPDLKNKKPMNDPENENDRPSS